MRRRRLFHRLRLLLWRGLHLLLLLLFLLLLRWSGLATRGMLGELVVIIMTLEAFARFELTLSLSARFPDQRGDLFFGFVAVAAPVTLDASPRWNRFAHLLDGR